MKKTLLIAFSFCIPIMTTQRPLIRKKRLNTQKDDRFAGLVKIGGLGIGFIGINILAAQGRVLYAMIQMQRDHKKREAKEKKLLQSKL